MAQLSDRGKKKLSRYVDAANSYPASNPQSVYDYVLTPTGVTKLFNPQKKAAHEAYLASQRVGQSPVYSFSGGHGGDYTLSAYTKENWTPNDQVQKGLDDGTLTLVNGKAVATNTLDNMPDFISYDPYGKHSRSVNLPAEMVTQLANEPGAGNEVRGSALSRIRRTNPTLTNFLDLPSFEEMNQAMHAYHDEKKASKFRLGKFIATRVAPAAIAAIGGSAILGGATPVSASGVSAGSAGAGSAASGATASSLLSAPTGSAAGYSAGAAGGNTIAGSLLSAPTGSAAGYSATAGGGGLFANLTNAYKAVRPFTTAASAINTGRKLLTKPEAPRMPKLPSIPASIASPAPLPELVPPPDPESPVTMPDEDDEDIQRRLRMIAAAQARRSGRASTFLTDDGVLE